jgi:hypothetical protein
MKTNQENNLVSWDDHLDNKYGKAGSPSRDKYEEGFENFKIGVLIQEARKQQNLILLYAIKEVHQQSRYTYGSPRIYKELNAKGYLCGIRLVERLMKVAKIYSKISKKFKHSTTNSNHKQELLLGSLR